MKKSLVASTLLLALFIVAAVVRGNYEFLFYAVTLIVLLGLLFLIDRKFDLSPLGLWAFNTWMLLHLIGGMGSIDGVRMYDFMLIELIGEPYNILRYDQFVHTFCYVAMSLLVYQVLAQMVTSGHRLALFVFTVIAATGIGGLNEVIEFAAVAFLGSEGVGNYTNNALDLVCNLIGAIIGATYMHTLSKSDA